MLGISSNLSITGILEGEERKHGAPKIFERIVVEDFSKLMTDTKPISETPSK